MMRSLQSRLGSGLLLSLVIAFALLTLLVSMNLRVLAEDYVASRLQHDTESLLTAVRFDQHGAITLDPQDIDPVYNQPFSGHYYVISSSTQTLYSRSLWDQRLDHVSLDSGQQERSIQAGPEQQSLLVLSSGYLRQGVPLSISLAEDLNPIQDDINRFIYVFVLIAGGILFVLILLQVIILRGSLKPLDRIHDELGLLEQGKVDRLNTDVPRELQPLINEVNSLLVIMSQRLQRSRDGLSDLAHAIKKPLTVMRQLINDNDIPEGNRHELARQTDEIVRLSDRILKRARLAGHSHAGRHFSFDEDLTALLDTLRMMYPDKQVELLRMISPGTRCPIDREDMMELLGNLLDNACKWARSKIRIQTESRHRLMISIEDDGPGIEPGRIQELSKRGRRLDESVAGHGFGLAIASDTVAEYKGRMEFKRSAELGGFRVDIELPINPE